MKVINFYTFQNNNVCYFDYQKTKLAIKVGIKRIDTYSIANLSMDLLDLGYKIYLISRSGKQIEIKEHMPELNKDLRKDHNVLKMYLSGIFDFLIYD